MLVKIDAQGANIVPDGAAKVRVSFELDSTGSSLEAVFECLACGDFLAHAVRETAGLPAAAAMSRPLRGGWQCVSCYYELHPVEAELVVGYAHVQLDRLVSKTRVEEVRTTQWGWVTWLRRLLRLKGA